MASVRLAIRDDYDYVPDHFAMLEGLNSVRFSFNVVATPPDRFGPPPPLRPLSLEAWRTYPSFGAGTWDFVSIQKLSNGERLSDARRLTSDGNSAGCSSANVVEVLAGDMQVSTVGAPFTTSSIRVKVSTRFPETASVGASAALVSEMIFDEALDTGIDGPKTALQTDSAGTANFAVTPGARTGIKRFIVKAHGSGGGDSASAMVTLAHAPLGAPVANSVPIVEYRYDGGSGAQTRYLTGSAAVTRQLDSRDDAKIFSRTGQVWRAFTDINAAPGLAAVCQFFGRLTSAATVSHFFTANAQECASLRTLWGDAGSAGPGLKYEGVAFYAVVPDAQQHCPSAFPLRIRRFFVPTPSPYHVYQLDAALDVRFIPNVINEGVAFCTDVATAFQ